MPLPKDRYPDPDNTLSSYAQLKLERNKRRNMVAELAIVERQVREARTWAIRMKRERDDYIKQLDNMCDEHCIVDVLKREKDAANDAYNWMFERWNEAARTIKVLRVSRAHWRESFERVSGERNRLAAALKKIKTLPFYTTERVFAVIDAALDGVEVDKELINSTWGKYNSTTQRCWRRELFLSWRGPEENLSLIHI